MDEVTKRCTKCGVEKELNEYYKYKRGKDGLQSQCKLCMNENNRKWRKENPKKIKEKNRKYYKESPKKIKEKNRKYYKENPEKIKEKNRKWQKENTEKERERNRKWYKENSEKHKERSRKWRKENPEKAREKSLRRRVLKANCEINDFTVEQWAQLKEEYNYRCAYCGCTPDKLDVEHIIPLSRGGNHTLSNIVPACRSCNSRKNAKTPEEAGMTFFDFEKETD